jgi:dTDP-4-amino-4,6-dideoxygalactose transaminase
MLHSRHYLDISTPDLVFGASGFLNRRDCTAVTKALESDIAAGAMVTFSVRSAWDLILTALDLPQGSEIIMSAVTIPHMARIAEAHGLIPVPIDLDPATLAPDIDLFARAFNPRTRLVMLAHLLGGRFAINPYAQVAAAHEVPIIEDCAQAFVGPHYWGSPLATASLFSFGSIKTSTSLGAAVAIVRSEELRSAMQEIHETRPIQQSGRFAQKAGKYLGVQSIRSPILYGAVASYAKRSKGGIDGFISRTVKGFPCDSTESLLQLLRQRPSAAQVALLRRRLDGFDGRRLAARAERGELLREKLRNAGEVLGRDQPSRTHWLFAIVVSDPSSLIEKLRSEGFDATQGATTIGALSAPPDKPEFDPVVIRDAMSRTVFLPAYPEMPESELLRMIDVIYA